MESYNGISISFFPIIHLVSPLRTIYDVPPWKPQRWHHSGHWLAKIKLLHLAVLKHAMLINHATRNCYGSQLLQNTCGPNFFTIRAFVLAQCGCVLVVESFDSHCHGAGLIHRGPTFPIAELFLITC